MTDEDFDFTTSFSFSESPGQDCVTVNLLADFSVEGDHRFDVELNSSKPSISTSGTTNITIQDTNGMFYNCFVKSVANLARIYQKMTLSSFEVMIHSICEYLNV